MVEQRLPAERERAQGHSASWVDGALIVRSGLVLAAVLAAVVGAAFALHASRIGGPDARFGPAVSGETVGAFPPPGLQVQAAEERERYFAEQREMAAQYTWIDRGHGIVRIPVERAMQLLATERTSADPEGKRR